MKLKNQLDLMLMVVAGDRNIVKVGNSC